MTTTTWIILIIAAAALAFTAFTVWKTRRTKEFRSKFGPEYDHLVEQRGSPSRAERELEDRIKRVEKFQIRPLNSSEAERFASAWRSTQTRFVDDPRGAVDNARQLVHDVMQARGYPTGGDFEERAADLSVNYPRVVEHYRAAYDLMRRDGHDTEDLRAAMKHYRALFEELVEQHHSAEANEVRR